MSNALTTALHYLKFRPRSVFEIERKLKTKRFEDKEIRRTIDILKKNQLLDDEKFAKMWVKDRNNFKPSGSYLLKLELKKFGIDSEIIEKVIEDQNEEDLAKKAIESKSRLKTADFLKKAEFLKRRGFSSSVIYKIIKNVKT